jgi:hypothetical protein
LLPLLWGAATSSAMSPYVEEFGARALRVVTLADGVTVHNAFPDRDFEEEPT